MRRVRTQHLVLPTVVLACLVALAVSPCWASHHRIEKGVLIGGGAGLIFGDGLGGALKGAAIGGAVAKVTTPGPEGKAARRSARTGAIIGGGAGLVFGHGLGDVLEGGLIGGVVGSLFGHHRRHH